MMGWSQRFAILEWGLVNLEKINEFLLRMKMDMRFQAYYHSLHDSLQLLQSRIFESPSLVVIQVEKKWSS